MTWRASILTLFPEMFPGPLGHSLAGKARDNGIWCLETIQMRDFATDRHHSVDDTPFGGGAGMVLRPDVVDAAVDRVSDERPILCLTPRGRRFSQADAVRLARGDGVILLCGRYEGIDQRVIEARDMEEISLGDYVLSGGEPAALVLLDAVVRLLPGVMGAADSAAEESFSNGLLEYPHYTRPAEWHGMGVPEVLLSGHHGAVAAWRRDQSERVTRERRPDLWLNYNAGSRAPVSPDPVSQAPNLPAPSLQAPVSQAPVLQAPTSQAPKLQTPTSQVPTSQGPVSQAAISRAQTARVPFSRTPVSRVPATHDQILTKGRRP